MKFLTNNGLNENLHEFFEKIVKPYISKEKIEVPWKNRKTTYSFIPENNWLFASNKSFCNTYYNNEIIVTYNQKSTENDNLIYCKLVRSFDGKTWEEIQDKAASAISLSKDFVRLENGTTIYGMTNTNTSTVISDDNFYQLQDGSVSSNKFLTNLPATFKFTLGVAKFYGYYAKKLKNKKVILYNIGKNAETSKNSNMYLIGDNSVLTDNGPTDLSLVFSTDANDGIKEVYETNNKLWVIVTHDDATNNIYSYKIYTANKNNLNFTLYTSFDRTSSTESLYYIINADDEGIRLLLRDSNNNSYRTIALSDILGNVIIGFPETYSGFQELETTIIDLKLSNGRTIARTKSGLAYTDDGGVSYSEIENFPYFTKKIIQLDNGNVLALTRETTVVNYESINGIWISYDNGEHFELKLEGNYQDICNFGNTVSLLTTEGNIETIEF